jgi:hypothetical protein
MDFDQLLSKHKLLILIDGLNEIEEEFKRSAFNDLKDLLEKYDTIDFIITSRKFGFINNFNVNIYELRKLNENQIMHLVVNVLDYQKGIFLWKQIEQNKQILELASNPLLLMMIIKVSSLKNNEIPANKGLLYKLFNDGILAREQKFYKTDIGTKKDILSYVAFWMRDNGIFKTIKKVQAKELIKKKLLEINHSLGVNEILNELSDNNILIEKNDELEFNHETQQEYFVALELKNIFFTNKNFDFDYSENKWFEPILICSDLFTKEEDIMNFFEMIFIGKKNEQPKHLDCIDSSDVNDKFFIACKVAFNLHLTHPLIFQRAEEFLNNYLVIWHYRYNETIITDFENLIRGIACLSSEVVFKKFFFNLKNLECWFYNSEFDKRSNNLDAIKSFDEKFRKYMKTFSENLNSFRILYRVLQARKKEFNYIHSLSRSVYNNVKIFSRYLLSNSPTNQLVEAFKETNSSEILFELGKSDLEYFIENYFSTKDANNIDFYTFITDYHLRNVSGVDFLIKSLKNEKIEVSIRLLILEKLLGTNDYVDSTLTALQEIFDKKDDLRFVEDTKQLLNKYSIDLLRSYGLDIIYTNPAIEKIDLQLKVFSEEENQVIFECHSNKINYGVVLNNINTILYNNIFVDFVNIEKLGKYNSVLILKGKPQEIEQSIEKFSSGTSFSVHYLDNKRRAKTKRFILKELYKGLAQDEILLRVRSQPGIIIKDVFNRFKKFKGIEVLIGQELRFSMKGLITYPNSIYLKCASGLFNSNEVLMNFKLFKINLELSFPYNYHRDIIKSNDTFIRYLQKQITNPEVVDFIKAVGLCFHFFEHIPNLNFGIVNYVYADSSYSVVRIKDGKMFIAYQKSCTNEEIQSNDLVIIEKNLNIAKVDIEKLNKENFVESEIITLNADKTEGFIEGTLEGDFYFLSQYCNFQPYKGLTVRFIPGVNFSKNNSSKPMAYCITLAVDKNNLARVSKIYKVCRHEDVFFDVYLIDINTGEELFSRVYSNRKISNLHRQIKMEDVFIYEIAGHFEKKFDIQRIYLLRLLD